MEIERFLIDVIQYSVWFYTMLCCEVQYYYLFYITVMYFAMLYFAMRYRTLLCGTVLYCIVLYCTAMYSTLKKYFSSPLEALHKIFNHFFRDRVSILHMTSASPYHCLKTFIYLSASSRIQRNLFISTL